MADKLAVFYTVAIDILFACSTRYGKEANARMRSGLFEIVELFKTSAFW